MVFTLNDILCCETLVVLAGLLFPRNSAQNAAGAA
jgi:hypothetical protein